MNGARIKNKWAVEGLSGESDGMASQSKGLAIHVNQERRLRTRQEGVLGVLLLDLLAYQEAKSTAKCPRSRIGNWRRMEVIWKKLLLGTQ